MLAQKQPLETNSDTMLHLLQGLRRNVDSVPPGSRLDFTNILDNLLHVATSSTIAISPSAITIALGPIYPDLPVLPTLFRRNRFHCLRFSASPHSANPALLR